MNSGIAPTLFIPASILLFHFSRKLLEFTLYFFWAYPENRDFITSILLLLSIFFLQPLPLLLGDQGDLHPFFGCKEEGTKVDPRSERVASPVKLKEGTDDHACIHIPSPKYQRSR